MFLYYQVKGKQSFPGKTNVDNSQIIVQSGMWHTLVCSTDNTKRLAHMLIRLFCSVSQFAIASVGGSGKPGLLGYDGNIGDGIVNFETPTEVKQGMRFLV